MISIKNLLYSAVTSYDHQQRTQCQQILYNEFLTNPIEVSNQLFNLICSMDKNDHILAYTFMKKLMQQNQQQKLIDFNQHMEKTFLYWYQQDLNRNTINQLYTVQKQNIINLHALFLSLHSSMKYRQQFIDIIPYKICQLCSKNDKYQLHFYLTFYGSVLKQLDKYRIGNINSKRAAMGSVMLLKVTTKLHPQNSVQASLWIDFSLNFSKFNRWVPDRNFLITCLSNYQLTKSSFINLLQFFSVNMNRNWTIEQHGKIMLSLQREMNFISQNIRNYECKYVETVLKCVRSLLYSFFSNDKTPGNEVELTIYQRFRSYNDFESISSFIMRVIDYFSQNNQNQVCGNLSQMIIEHSTQVMRMYVSYLQQETVEGYARQFIGEYNGSENWQRILVLLSGMPKFILSLFEYENITNQLLSGNMALRQNYQPIYVNYLTHIVQVNQYMEIQTIQKIGKFFYTLISNRQHIITQLSSTQLNNSTKQNNQQQQQQSIQRMSLSLYGLSKLAKYKEFTNNNNGQYFQMMEQKIFGLLLIASNDFSLLIDCINELINQQNQQWNKFICTKCMHMLSTIYQNKLKSTKLQYYQLQIQLYRIINRTFSLTNILDSIQQIITQTDFINKINIEQFTQLKLILQICRLQAKSQPVKEQIILLTQNILIHANQLLSQGKFLLIHSLLTQLVQSLTDKLLFQQIFNTLSDTQQFLQQNGSQFSNTFNKVSIASQQYAIVDYGPSKQLHLSCIKILLQLLIYQQYLQTIYNIISKLKSQYLLCVWQAIQILYPGKILSNLIPTIVQQRLQKIRTGHILDLLQSMGLNEQTKVKLSSTPSWYQLYRNILRQDSVVIDIIHQKVNQQQ